LAANRVQCEPHLSNGAAMLFDADVVNREHCQLHSRLQARIVSGYCGHYLKIQYVRKLERLYIFTTPVFWFGVCLQRLIIYDVTHKSLEVIHSLRLANLFSYHSDISLLTLLICTYKLVLFFKSKSIQSAVILSYAIKIVNI
jgi:hypothetical protein